MDFAQWTEMSFVSSISRDIRDRHFLFCGRSFQCKSFDQWYAKRMKLAPDDEMFCLVRNFGVTSGLCLEAKGPNFKAPLPRQKETHGLCTEHCNRRVLWIINELGHKTASREKAFALISNRWFSNWALSSTTSSCTMNKHSPFTCLSWKLGHKFRSRNQTRGALKQSAWFL